jgi:hypothetical protein
VPDERTSNGVRFLYGLTLLKEAKPSMASLIDKVEHGESSTAEVFNETEDETDVPNDHRETVQIIFSEKYEGQGQDDAVENPSEEETDDDGEDLKLRGTDFEEEERLALEKALDHESIQFDLNYLPARVFRKLGVNEWLDGRPEYFDFDDFPFERKAVGGFEFVSLR